MITETFTAMLVGDWCPHIVDPPEQDQHSCFFSIEMVCYPRGRTLSDNVYSNMSNKVRTWEKGTLEIERTIDIPLNPPSDTGRVEYRKHFLNPSRLFVLGNDYQLALHPVSPWEKLTTQFFRFRS